MPKGGQGHNKELNMTNYRFIRTGLASALLAGGAALVVPSIASASVQYRTSHDFTTNQKDLEAQLTIRVSQLARLSTDVTGAKTLTTVHAAALTTNINTATANINALVVRVPTDTTNAQVNADRAAMIRQNRVFAVLTPQVFLTIEADAIGAEVTSLQTEEPGLLSAVNGLVGEHGYTNAFNHYTLFLKQVNQASINSTNIATRVLAQVPQNFPRDTDVFVHANKELLASDIALAHANYDASVIGLASGGYTGA